MGVRGLLLLILNFAPRGTMAARDTMMHDFPGGGLGKNAAQRSLGTGCRKED